MAGRGDRTGDLRRLELVREEPGRHVAPRLERVDDAEPEVDAHERYSCEQAISDRAAGPRPRLLDAPRRGNRAHSVTAPKTTAGSMSMSRRTNRHDTSARLHASITRSRRPRSASGIV